MVRFKGALETIIHWQPQWTFLKFCLNQSVSLLHTTKDFKSSMTSETPMAILGWKAGSNPTVTAAVQRLTRLQRCLIFPLKFYLPGSLVSLPAPARPYSPCGDERQKVIGVKNRAVPALSPFGVPCWRWVVIWCWKRCQNQKSDKLIMILSFPILLYHWCTFCERCIMCSGDLFLWADLLLKALCNHIRCVHLVFCTTVWFFLAALQGRPVPAMGERGQAATTAVSLKTPSKLLFRLPALQTR